MPDYNPFETATQAATIAKYNGQLVEVVDTWTTQQGAMLVTIQLPNGTRRTVYASQVEVCHA